MKKAFWRIFGLKQIAAAAAATPEFWTLGAKKAIMVLIALAVLAAPGAALASVITDALYRATISVTNNGTMASNVATVMTLDTQTLIDSFDVDADLGDIAIHDSNGNDVKFQPSANSTLPWALWVDSIGGYATELFTLFFPDTVNGTPAYFPGPTGMTISDSADMEPGGNFTAELDGHFNTEYSTNQTYLDKFGAFKIHSGSAGNITAEMPSNPPTLAAVNGGNDVVNQLNHTVNLPAGINAGDLLLVFFASDGLPVITFPPGDWTELANLGAASGAHSWAVAYRIADGGEAATITVTTGVAEMTAHTTYRITDYAGVPEIATLDWAGVDPNPDSPNLAPSWGSASALWLSVTGYHDGTTAVTVYPAGYGNTRNDRANNAQGVGVGTATLALSAANENPGAYTLSVGEAWTSSTLAIRSGVQVSVSAGDLPSAEYNVIAAANSTDLGLWVDGSLVDTVALGGVTVPDNANDWITSFNATMPYLNFQKITVGGNLVSHIAWENDDTTFTDLSGNGNDASPSFRTASSAENVSATISAVQPVSLAVSDIAPGGAWPSMLTAVPDEPGKLYTDTDRPGFFFEPLVHVFLVLGSIPDSFFWYNFCFFIIIFAGMIAYRIHPSLVIKAVVMGALMAFFAHGNLNVYGFYTLLYFAFYCFGIIIVSRSYGL